MVHFMTILSPGMHGSLSAEWGEVPLCPCISVCWQFAATGYWTRKVLFTMLCVFQMCRWWSCGSCVGFDLGWWRAYKYLINMYSRWPGATQIWFMKASSLHTGLETTWFWSFTLHAWLAANLWVVFSFQIYSPHVLLKLKNTFISPEYSLILCLHTSSFFNSFKNDSVFIMPPNFYHLYVASGLRHAPDLMPEQFHQKKSLCRNIFWGKYYSLRL